MVHTKGFRPRNGATVRDARDVIRNKGGRRPGGNRGPSVGGVSSSKRIIRTSTGLVTNKKPRGISTSQLPHRQREQRARPVTINRANPRPPPRSGEGLTATIRRSHIIKNSPVLQSILCYLMPMDSTVGARADGLEDDTTLQTGIAVPPAPAAVESKTTPKTTHQDLNRNESTGEARDDDRSEEISRLEHSLGDHLGDPDGNLEVNQNMNPSPKEDIEIARDVVPTIEDPAEPQGASDGVSEAKDGSQDPLADSDSEVDDFELPKTCQMLKAPNGCLVYVVGSAHFSRESQNDVRRVIRRIKPKRVMVELCKQRVHILTMDENILMRESSNISLQMIREAISKMGTLQGGMYILLMQLSAHLSSKLKIAPGGEFRMAYQEANRLENCQIFLGDRQLNITLKRAWASLGVWQRISIIWTLLFTDEEISAEDVERCKDKDILEQLLGEMCVNHPDLSRVLIAERDRYLCRSLYNVAMSSPVPSSVVAVVGIGHQRGITEHWDKAEDIDLHQLSVIPQASLGVRVTNRALVIGMWVGVGFVVYKLTPRGLRSALASGVEQGLRIGGEKLSLLWK
ncbi:traB domain-containing protein [Galendromus occidentalis]|uniref:TraB domain-containing protein n=1 Tax=Galendromus occidentalis TaxID=34638 RepID=A0AAJ7L4I2_9ACAR|nr:traB domain-containing protein [Galendromus occidentalis]